LTTVDNRLSVINTYYSHLSRLWVSNYATFFAVFLAFLASLYTVASKNDELSIKNYFFYLSFMIMIFELALLYRGLQFSRVLSEIDLIWAKESIFDVGAAFWTREPWIKWSDRIYRAGSILLAVIITICIPLLSWFFLLRT
jgi:hypothetical protein